MEGGSSTGDFDRWMKRALGIRRFAPKRLTAEGSGEGFFTGDPGRRVTKIKKGSRYGHLSP